MLSSVLPSLDCSWCPTWHLKLRCFDTAVYFWGCCSRRCEVTQYRNKTFRHVLIAELCNSLPSRCPFKTSSSVLETQKAQKLIFQDSVPIRDLIKKFGMKRCCAFPPPLTPKMYMMMPEHGQQKRNKRNPSNMLRTEHVLYVNKLYMVPSLRMIANFLICGTLQFPIKICSNRCQGAEQLLIGKGLFSLKINPSEY